MNRFLQWFNLLGVGALAVCCAVQWGANRRLNLRRLELETEQLVQAQALGDKDQTITGNIADMNEFRARLVRSEAALEEAQAAGNAGAGKLAEATAQVAQLQSANDALTKSLEQWKAAVAARDEALKQAEEQTRKLAADRNDAIGQFNELAARYNAAEEQLKQAVEQVKKLAADRNEAVARFNELANKYNALVQERKEGTTRP